MGAVSRVIGGLRALFRRGREDRELDAELRAYLDAAIEQKMRSGLPREEARRTALAEMGSIPALTDHTRDAGWETSVENLWRDLRYAGRTLRNSPAFSAIAVLTLALGIGANSAIFTVVNAVMLRPLPVPRPHELRALSVVYPGSTEPIFSYAAYRRFAGEAASIGAVAAASSVRRESIVIEGTPEPVDYKWISGNFFDVLEVPAVVGRAVVPADDRLPSGEPVAVLSHAYWTRRFAGDPSVVGRTFRLRAQPVTIVGVAPPGFFGETSGEAPDIWLPMTAQRDAPPWLWQGHSTTWLGLVVRVRRDVPPDQARAVLEAIYGRVRDEVAGGTDSTEFRSATLASRLAVSDATAGSSRLRGQLSTPLTILMALVGLVLLITCANVANLMLARAEARRRATAVCLAIGAGRLRVVRQALAEALWLACLGGLAGLLLAYQVGSAIASLAAGQLNLSLQIAPDLRVLTFTLLVSIATAFVAGAAPALRAGRVDPLPALKSAAGSGHEPARLRLRRTLVVLQIAVSLVLLVAAGLFARSLARLQNIDVGFTPEGVLLFDVAPPSSERPLGVEERRAIVRALLDRAAMIPGVHAASASVSGLFGRGAWRNAITIEGYVPPPDVVPRSFANAVSADYFDVMRMRVLRGRSFAARDKASAPGVAVVNQAFARQFLGGAAALGRRVGLCSSSPCGEPRGGMMEVVGVVEDAKYYALREDPRPMLFVPLMQLEQNPRELEVRTTGDPAALAATVFRELSNVDSRLAIVAMRTLRDQVDGSILPERLVARLSMVFGLLALALAAVGLYGVVAYVTAQRTGEIGIRMALGAGAREVRRLVLRDTFRLVLAGVTIGLPLALVVARLLASQLYQIGPADPVAVATGMIALSLTALVAGYLPAWRASRVDPLTALRNE
jgi:predicted permease